MTTNDAPDTELPASYCRVLPPFAFNSIIRPSEIDLAVFPVFP